MFFGSHSSTIALTFKVNRPVFSLENCSPSHLTRCEFMAPLEILAVRPAIQHAGFQLSRMVVAWPPQSNMLSFGIFLLPPLWLFPCSTVPSQQPVPFPTPTIVVLEKGN